MSGDDTPELLWRGKWLRMMRRGHWEYAERTNANGVSVIIIAATPEAKLLFVEQTRVPIQRKTIEMPASRCCWRRNASCWKRPAGAPVASST